MEIPPNSIGFSDANPVDFSESKARLAIVHELFKIQPPHAPGKTSFAHGSNRHGLRFPRPRPRSRLIDLLSTEHEKRPSGLFPVQEENRAR